MQRFAAFAVLATLAACGDDAPTPPAPPPDPPTSVDDVVAKLTALPGVTATIEPTNETGYDYVVVHFTQPVDHADPGGQTFQQEVSLLVKQGGGAAPMIVHTSGYFDYYQDNPVELTDLLGANQVSIEHRFFGESRPAPADWSKLTIEQMADDEHAIIVALRSVFPGAFLTTGGSKGGMTAIYHRRFYPDDVDGTVPYVAPISFGAPDPRYNAFVDAVGPSDCHAAVRAVAVEMLQHRRAALLSRAQTQATQQQLAYTRIQIGPALEISIEALEWAFWQYAGIGFCPSVPATTATDDELFDFLDQVAPVSDNSDDQVAAFEAYYHQAYAQLGYPDDYTAYLAPYAMYSDADFDGALPAGKPAYDGGAAMHDIDDWVQHDGDRLLFVYGEWDPWTGGAFELGGATDSLRLVQAQGTHGSHITRLAAADRDAAFAKLEAWTGVKPAGSAVRRRAERPVDRPLRVPPVLLRLR